MDKRTGIDEILGIAVEIRLPRETRCSQVEQDAYKRGDLIIRRKDNSEIVATVPAESLFDANGNRFWFR